MLVRLKVPFQKSPVFFLESLSCLCWGFSEDFVFLRFRSFQGTLSDFVSKSGREIFGGSLSKVFTVKSAVKASLDLSFFDDPLRVFWLMIFSSLCILKNFWGFLESFGRVWSHICLEMFPLGLLVNLFMTNVAGASEAVFHFLRWAFCCLLRWDFLGRF